MADRMIATPMANPILGLLADRLKKAQQFAANPYGYANHPAEMLLNLLGVPAVQQTMERMAYGEPLTTGSGMTTKPRAEAVEAAMTVAPVAGLLGRATKGLPVGASIKNIGTSIFDDATKYHQKVPEIKSINVDKLKRMNSGEVAEVSDEVAAKMDFSKPIEVSVFSDGELRIVDGHHRVAAAKKLGITSLPVDLQAINARGTTLNKLALESTYPQQYALDLAQKRAALPIEQGGLGLPADNTAMDRAKAMGFDINAFHGSKDPNILAFDPSMAGKSTSNAFEQNIWATSSPEVARGYSLDTSQFATTPQAQEINAKIQGLSEKYNAAYQSGKFDEMDALREQINAAQNQSKDLYKSFLNGEIASEESTIYPLMMRGSELMPYEAEGKNWMRVNRQAIEQAKEGGYGGVNIRNVSDNTQASDKIISDTYATENPDLIRSRFAAFDPFRKTAAIAAAMGVAAPNLMAQEVDYTLLPPEKKEELLRSLLGQ
jgi:hypothetical protein